MTYSDQDRAAMAEAFTKVTKPFEDVGTKERVADLYFMLGARIGIAYRDERENSHPLGQTAPSVAQDARGGEFDPDTDRIAFDSWYTYKSPVLVSSAFTSYIATARVAWNAALAYRDAEIAAIRAENNALNLQLTLIDAGHNHVIETQKKVKEALDELGKEIRLLRDERDTLRAENDELRHTIGMKMPTLEMAHAYDGDEIDRLRATVTRIEVENARGAAVIAAAVALYEAEQDPSKTEDEIDELHENLTMDTGDFVRARGST